MTVDRYPYSLDLLRPTDASELARIHKEAFPGFFLSELGVRFLTEFYLGYSTDPSAVTCVARDMDGKPLGAVVGTTEPSGFYSRLLRRRLWGFGVAALRATIEAPHRAPRLVKALTYRGDVPNAEANWALLASICVDPSVQSYGMGSSLIGEWTSRAAKLGASKAFLNTDSGNNESVNNFYQRHGWTLAETYQTRQGRGMNRYCRTLQNLQHGI